MPMIFWKNGDPLERNRESIEEGQVQGEREMGSVLETLSLRLPIGRQDVQQTISNTRLKPWEETAAGKFDLKAICIEMIVKPMELKILLEDSRGNRGDDPGQNLVEHPQLDGMIYMYDEQMRLTMSSQTGKKQTKRVI